MFFFVVENSNYTPDFLTSCGALDFYHIVRRIEQKMQNKAQPPAPDWLK